MSKSESDKDILDEIIALWSLPQHPNMLKIVAICCDFQNQNRIALTSEYQINESLDKFVKRFHPRKKIENKRISNNFF